MEYCAEKLKTTLKVKILGIVSVKTCLGYNDRKFEIRAAMSHRKSETRVA